MRKHTPLTWKFVSGECQQCEFGQSCIYLSSISHRIDVQKFWLLPRSCSTAPGGNEMAKWPNPVGYFRGGKFEL